MKFLPSLFLTLVVHSVVTAAPRPVVVAYVPNWIDLNRFAPSIDYPKVTHLNLAFENPTNDDGDMSWNPQDAVLVRQARSHQVKVLLSIGGGSASGDKVLLARYARLLGPEKREGFARKLAAFVARHEFDGLDVDLEGPSITADYGPFIELLRTATSERKLLLTCALSQGYGGDHVPDAALSKFDLVNMMAYDGTGPWNPKAPGQHSSMAMAERTTAYWLGRGLAKEKAVLGVPFYGYGFGTAFKNRDYPYAEILKTHPGAENADQIGETIWYNGKATIRAKCEFVKKSGLAGVMIWSLDSDAPGEQSLLKVIAEAFADPPKEGK